MIIQGRLLVGIAPHKAYFGNRRFLFGYLTAESSGGLGNIRGITCSQRHRSLIGLCKNAQIVNIRILRTFIRNLDTVHRTAVDGSRNNLSAGRGLYGCPACTLVSRGIYLHGITTQIEGYLAHAIAQHRRNDIRTILRQSKVLCPAVDITAIR